MNQIEIAGGGIVDRHTHYEAYSFIGSERATVIIRGDIVAHFQEKYGIPITQAKKLQVAVDFGRNDQRVKECQDSYRPARHLIGSINSLDEIEFKSD